MPNHYRGTVEFLLQSRLPRRRVAQESLRQLAVGAQPARQHADLQGASALGRVLDPLRRGEQGRRYHRARHARAPAMHVGGWVDIFLQGTLDNSTTRQTHGGAGAKGNQKLIMRCAVHNGRDDRDYKPNRNRGDFDVGQLERQFMDYWMKGEQNGIMDQPAVWYYTMGDDRDPNAPGNEWRTANAWPPFPTTETPFYLAPDGILMSEPGADPGRLDYAFDPMKPLRTDGGANLFMPAGPYDQRKTNNGRKDLLKFATPPLAAPLEATGLISVKLFVSTDAPDTDFTAKLVDIFPPGDDREILILDSIQRLKYRNGFDKAAPPLASPDEIVEVTIDLWSTSWIFNANHRIGVQISSSNYPRFEVNPNTGDDFPDKVKMRVSHNAVHIGKPHPSALILPVR
ncbi:MAG: CocE/NonD family hydrolase [Candidatus Hydrogenedentes bacterium]|nr:CocE/NonD family hydrolase [Candidatus Hydrogenedentota bacterium]